ncbi:MAG TPA: hypothetical protein VKA08_00390 [Balneolales bacterium]|nr:hypothetical protein [Balneolales bacterium]
MSRISSISCQLYYALDENEIVNEYFRTNLKSDRISTQKRKAFCRRVNIIHDINATCIGSEKTVARETMPRGDKMEVKRDQTPPLSFYVLRPAGGRRIPSAPGNDCHTGTVRCPLLTGS